MLPINVLREIKSLYPDRSAALDDWQRSFIQEQLARFERWGDDLRLSEKQAVALEKALVVMRKSEGGQQ